MTLSVTLNKQFYSFMKKFYNFRVFMEYSESIENIEYAIICSFTEKCCPSLTYEK